MRSCSVSICNPLFLIVRKIVSVELHVSCYFTDHSESLDLTINFSSSTFDNGQRNATVLVCSLYLEPIDISNIDWEQRRYEIAKSVYAATNHISAKDAVWDADLLIKELKK